MKNWRVIEMGKELKDLRSKLKELKVDDENKAFLEALITELEHLWTFTIDTVLANVSDIRSRFFEYETKEEKKR